MKFIENGLQCECMCVSVEILMKQFIRTYLYEFTARDMSKIMTLCGVKAPVSECVNFLEENPYVFPLQKKRYITQAGAFTGKLFSFRPTIFELKNHAFAIGHRCIPFADSEIVSSSLQFYYAGKRLPVKVVEFDSEEALDLFSLYGEEYSTQYIASDPANKNLDLVFHDFQLPSKVNLTCFSLEPLLKSNNFHYGSRILCRIADWDAGKIEIVPQIIKNGDNFVRIKESDVARQNWYCILEKRLLDSFEIQGPCSSIEEQLSYVFFEYCDELCVSDCGSIEEYMQYAHNVGIEFFGVETRLWYKGKDVPAVGTWNEMEQWPIEKRRKEFDIPDYVVDSYLKDYMYQKNIDLRDCMNSIFPKSFVLTAEEKKRILLHLAARNDIILKNYNWFADFKIGSVRHRALKLYSKLSALTYDIDSAGKNLKKFPQQELVILSQLFSHLSHIIEAIENEPVYVVQDFDAIMLSLEGMEFNFEEIEDVLCSAVAEFRKTDFTII